MPTKGCRANDDDDDDDDSRELRQNRVLQKGFILVYYSICGSFNIHFSNYVNKCKLQGHTVNVCHSHMRVGKYELQDHAAVVFVIMYKTTNRNVTF